MTRTLAARARRVSVEIESPADLLLGARILGLALFVRVMKYVLPLPRLVRAMTPAVRPGARDRERERRIATFSRWAARLVRPRDAGSCLERSVVIYRELTRAHATPRLCIGFRRDGTDVAGHAWVIVDGMPVADSPAVCDAYDVAMAFDAGAPHRDAA